MAKVAEARALVESAQVKSRDEVRRALLDLEAREANLIKADEQLKLARRA